MVQSEFGFVHSTDNTIKKQTSCQIKIDGGIEFSHPDDNMAPKNSKSSTVTWIKIVAIVLVIGIFKYSYDELASEGNPLTALLFKIRAPYLDPGYLRKVVPTAFRMVSGEKTAKIDAGTESFSIDYTFSYPQLEYYGEVLGRSELNRLLRANFETVEARMLDDLKKDACAHLTNKTLIPGFGSQSASLKIQGDVAYFSKSIVAIRYRIHWSFGGKRQLYPAQRVAGFSVDIAQSRALQLRDVLGYPYQDFIVRLWDRARVDLDEAHRDTSQFNLYKDDPEFYISPAGLVLVNLSDNPDYSEVDVKISFRDNRSLFRSSGPIAQITNPSRHGELNP